MAKQRINVTQIEDLVAKQNFELLRQAFDTNPFLKGSWKFIEFTVNAAVTGFLYKHNLNFIPKDAILLSSIGSSVVFNYAQFDDTNISVTTTGPCTLRAFIGTYSEN